MRGADYPFGAPAGPGLLAADGSWADGTPGREWPGRTAVVAVGSNVVPDVVHAKLAAADVAGDDVPFVPCELCGLGIAHSAHVSPGGYVPTTPFAETGAVATLVVSWFTGPQLAALDATEPNYSRVRLPAACGVPGAQVYVSRWGVLAPAGEPLRPTTQAGVHGVLAGDAGLAAMLPLAGPESTVAALRDPLTARRVRERLVELGWVLPTGLG